jgi:hypothetical protein
MVTGANNRGMVHDVPNETRINMYSSAEMVEGSGDVGEGESWVECDAEGIAWAHAVVEAGVKCGRDSLHDFTTCDGWWEGHDLWEEAKDSISRGGNV